MGFLFGVLWCLFVGIVISMGRWSEARAVRVVHVARFAVCVSVMVMSGDEGCWLLAAGRRGVVNCGSP